MRRLLQLLALLAITAPPAAAQERRVALVIGIDAYGGDAAGQMAPLRNAIADARALRAALRATQFEIVGTEQTTEDLSRDEFELVLAAFAERARGTDVALIALHGHGIAGEGRDSLFLQRDFPVAALGGSGLRRRRGFSVEEIASFLDRTDAARKVLIADACQEQLVNRGEAIARGAGLTRGLEPVDPPTDALMVVYSAEHRQVAYDRLSPSDPEPNGVFIRHFPPYLRTPGISLIQAVERADGEVRRATRNLPHGPQHIDVRVRGGGLSDLILTAARVAVMPAPPVQPAALPVPG
jgi:ribosomal protein S9